MTYMFFDMQVLWPYLLEFLVPVQYTGAVGIVSKCIADIGKVKREEDAEDYELNFNELGMCIFVHGLACLTNSLPLFPANIPRQPELIGRLIVSY